MACREGTPPRRLGSNCSSSSRSEELISTNPRTSLTLASTSIPSIVNFPLDPEVVSQSERCPCSIRSFTIISTPASTRVSKRALSSSVATWTTFLLAVESVIIMSPVTTISNKRTCSNTAPLMYALGRNGTCTFRGFRSRIHTFDQSIDDRLGFVLVAHHMWHQKYDEFRPTHI